MRSIGLGHNAKDPTFSAIAIGLEQSRVERAV